MEVVLGLPSYISKWSLFSYSQSVKEYVFEVGGKEHILQVPAEFDFDTLIAQKFAGIENLRDLPLIVSQDQGLLETA